MELGPSTSDPDQSNPPQTLFVLSFPSFSLVDPNSHEYIAAKSSGAVDYDEAATDDSAVATFPSAKAFVVLSQPEQSQGTKRIISKLMKAGKSETILPCEWGSCETDYKDLKDFMVHVSDHISYDLKKESISLAENIEDESFLCRWRDCLFSSDSREDMVRHINFHTFHTQLKSDGAETIKKLSLNHCKRDFTQRNILPELAEPFLCYWEGCPEANREFPEPLKFYWHVIWHSVEYDKKAKHFSCKWTGCSEVRTQISKLKEHLRYHTQERTIACPFCGGLFCNRSKFIEHCKRQAPEEELQFQCSFCPKRFAIERMLKSHLKSHINCYKCSYCEMTVPSPSALAAHMTYKHSDEKNFPCEEPDCTYRAKTATDLAVHAKIHYGVNDFRCTVKGCLYRCKVKQTLQRHVRQAHEGAGSRYCCHLCPKKFLRGRYLTVHLQRVHNFAVPFSRMRYQKDAEGFYKMQTIRYESSELKFAPINVHLNSVEDYMEESDPDIVYEDDDDDENF